MRASRHNSRAIVLGARLGREGGGGRCYALFNPDGPREGGGRGIEVGSDLFRVIVPARGVFVPCKRHWAGEGEGEATEAAASETATAWTGGRRLFLRTYVRGRPGALTSHRIDVIPDATLPYRSYVFIIPYRQLVTPVALPLPSPSPFIRYTVLLGVVPPYIYIYISSNIFHYPS